MKGWWEANASAKRQSSAAVRSITLRYEDLVETEVLTSALKELPAASSSHVLGHAIAGNRVRRSEEVNLVFRPDLAWHTSLPAGWRVLATAVERTAFASRVVARPRAGD